MTNILMLGPRLDVRGGITSVEKIILEKQKRFDLDILFLPTYIGGSFITKLAYAFYALVKYLILLLVKRKIRVAYFHLSHYAGFYRKSVFVLIASLFRKAIVLHMHGSDFDIFYSKSSGLSKRYISYILGRASKIIVLSGKWKAFYKEIVNADKIETVYNSVDVPGEIRYNPKGEYITFLGILGQRKGTYDIIRTIPDIIKEFPYIKYILAGDGEVEKARALVKELGIESHVTVPGWIDSERKAALLRNTILFLLPSYNEGLPMSVLEAMSYGIPVIASNVGGLGEVIKDENYGLLVEPGDTSALKAFTRALLEDERRRLEISSCCYMNIRNNFNTETFLKNLREVVGKL